MTSQLELGGLGEPEDGDEPKVVVEKDLDVLAQGWTVYWTRSIKALFFESWFNLCMLAAPFAAYYYYTDVDGNNAAMTFGCSLVAIAPFAERLSFVTEQLAMHTSETLGGLLNATFGNVTELVVSLIALNRGLHLELGILDQGNNFFGKFLVDTLFEGDILLDQLAGRKWLTRIQTANIDLALGQTELENADHLL